MNIEHLSDFLKEKNVPEYYYSIGGETIGEGSGIDFTDGRWITYGIDRGQRMDVTAHASEAAAVAAFLQDLRNLITTYEGRAPTWRPPIDS